MPKRSVQKLGLICIILLLGLTGCTSSGIHVFSPIWLVGEVRESSILDQPIPNLAIHSRSGEIIGWTDGNGQFRVQTKPVNGIVELTFVSPYYQTETRTWPIVGSSSLTVELDVLYLKPEGGGEINGQIRRQINLPKIKPQSIGSAQLAGEGEVASAAIPNEYNLATTQSREWLLSKLAGRGEVLIESAGGFYSVRLHSSEQEQVIQELRALEEIEYMIPNRQIHLMGMGSNEELWSDLWNMQLLEMNSAWQYATGEGVVVAVLDTLYSTSHPDLEANLLPALDVNGVQEEGLLLAEHGLHVAGIIGAAADGAGIIGMAPNVSILPVRIFNLNGGASISNLVKGIDLAIQHGAQVINLSVGTATDSPDMREAVERAYQAGVVLVGAAGNHGKTELLYPAAYPEVIGVGAVDSQGKPTSYSHSGVGIELMAPGGDLEATVLSTGIKGNYVGMYGTSMATPHVSGLVALMISYGVTDPDYLRLILRETARDLGSPGYDTYTGYGLIDPYAALSRFRSTYVFFGGVSLETGVAEVHSPVYQVEVDGQYEILNILPGKGQVVGWVDINQNLVIDQGDYIGQSPELTITDGMISRQDLELTWIEGEFDAIQIHALF